MLDTNQALVLDFGGVISRTLFETHALSEAALGLPPGTLGWRGPFDPDGDALWRAMQADEITERDYWHRRTQEVAKLAGRDWSKMSDFVRAARGADAAQVIRPEALAAIATVKQASMKLAVLSNELDLFYGAEFRQRLPFLADVDAIVDATYTGVLKPDPGAYRTCIEALGLPAPACVFVDDQIRNIDGARAFGMRTVHFDVLDPAGSYTRALDLLGLGPDA